MVPKRIIDRIRKLLATAGDERNESSSERELALERAKQIAKKWKVKLEEIGQEDEPFKGPKSHARGRGGRMRFHERLASIVVQDVYDVVVLGADRPGGRSLFTFVGENHERARLKWEAIITSMEDTWEEERKRRIIAAERLAKSKSSFMAGFHYGLKDKMMRERLRAKNRRVPWETLPAPEARKLKQPKTKELPPGPTYPPWEPPPPNPYALVLVESGVVIEVPKDITERHIETDEQKIRDEDKDPPRGEECELDYYTAGVTKGVESQIKYD